MTDAAGKRFNPHVTIGVGTVAYLKTMLAEPFDTFTFSPAGASLFQSRQLRHRSKGTQGLEADAMGADDPLPSWNDTKPKKAVVALVDRVTTPGSSEFVPEPDQRIEPPGEPNAPPFGFLRASRFASATTSGRVSTWLLRP